VSRTVPRTDLNAATATRYEPRPSSPNTMWHGYETQTLVRMSIAWSPSPSRMPGTAGGSLTPLKPHSPTVLGHRNHLHRNEAACRGNGLLRNV